MGCLLLLCAVPGWGQVSSAPAAAGGTPTIRTTARLVVVDVVVTDSHGDPVKGLKQSDFHLSEKKSPQTIRSFEEHTGSSAAGGAMAAPKLQPGVFTNATVAAPDPTVDVLLLDTINTPMVDQSFVRGQLLGYLRSAKPGSRIAIFGLRTRLVMLQGFTSDTEMLRRAVERSDPLASPTLAEKIGGKDDVVASQVGPIEQQLSVSPQMRQALAEFDAIEKHTDENLSAGYTLHGLNQLARYLAGIPGRKNLMWFSASFPLTILPHAATGSDPFAGSAAWQAEYRETVDLLTKSRVAVYPIDARGLLPSTVLQASNDGGAYAGRSSRPQMRAERSFSDAMFTSQSTMFEMANDTGGKAYVNTNGLAQAVEKVVDAGSNYYTLSYTPTDGNAHGEYRSIRVDVEGAGYTLAYRRGYYADTNETAPMVADVVKSAELSSAPAATQIPFYVRVLPVTAEDAARRELGKDGGTAYQVEYSIDPRGLSIASAADGTHRGHVEFIALVYDSDGKTVESDVKPVRVTWSASQFEAALQHGVRYQQEILVPDKGAYSLRVLVHDLPGNKIGAIDVPAVDLKIQPGGVKAEMAPGASSPQPRDR
ncbi:MAG: VWA domain-containing protein [Edaphobacter sp.]